MSIKSKKILLIGDILESCEQRLSSVPLWKTKGVSITLENLERHVFTLSTDLASYFNIRHDHLVERNIYKLQKKGYLANHFPTFGEMVEIGSSAQRMRLVYALTQDQTEHLIADFSGSKAWEKKHAILTSLQEIRSAVRQGDYAKAREKAQTWDGVQLLKDLGFISSIPNNIATKKDIIQFLKIPESTLNNFLRKHNQNIKPISLDLETIKALGSKAKHMKGYSFDDVAKITFGMDTEKGIEAKKMLFGNIGNFLKIETKGEIEWRSVLSKVFEGFDLRYNHPIGSYRVDFFIPNFFGFGLCLECNGYCHKFYDLEEEKRREEYIRERYALVRFHHKISLEDLVNGILKAKPKEVITLYNIEQLV